ncbi:MAG: hypothetical protein NZ891_03175, partial [bacterium]|nr:hypothetical protein [bacterium]MDW8163727.1 hypothetical protein [Candidatus Omnitrophota bacterium]
NISMGNKDDEMILFHIADEPGWYYPGIVENLKGKESRLEVFRNYLDSKGFTPEFFGKEIWNEIFPLNLSEIKTKGDKKIFYWTTRFFAESLSNAFSLATKAFVKNYNKKILTTTNLNNWPGRFFIPSPGKHIGNNPDRGPNAAMGAPDWFDLGRKKAVTCIWTEDWFGDNSAQLWSFYGDLLRCAARQGDIEFGGYIVGQGLGSVEDGGKYKTLALIGHGAKAVEFYIFGPYYAFIDGWSENKNAYKSIADALRLVGKAEELLFLGRPKDGTVAILFPISSQVWDNDSSLPLYLLELYGLHEGLIHENYPVDFIDDFDVENGILKNKNYSVLYVTAPNLSEKAQRQILNYVKNGGILVLMPGACAFDEYNEPLSIITEKSETKNIQVKRESSAAIEKEKRLEKSIIFKEKLFDFKNIISIKFQSVPLEVKNGKIVAEYNDGTPAISEVKYEKGIIISYGFWPGVNYHFSQDNNRGDRLPIGWDENIRKIITYPALIANTKKYVEISESLVEGCYLISEKGIAIVLLNWSGKPLSNIDLIIDGVKNCKFVKSVELGKVLNHEKINENKIKINLPLKTVDIVLIFFE